MHVICSVKHIPEPTYYKTVIGQHPLQLFCSVLYMFHSNNKIMIRQQQLTLIVHISKFQNREMFCCFSTEIFLCIFFRKDCSNLLFFFLAFDFVGSAWPFVFFIPAITANDLGFLSITFLYYLYSSERDCISLFNVECQTRELPVPFL